MTAHLVPSRRRRCLDFLENAKKYKKGHCGGQNHLREASSATTNTILYPPPRSCRYSRHFGGRPSARQAFARTVCVLSHRRRRGMLAKNPACSKVCPYQNQSHQCHRTELTFKDLLNGLNQDKRARSPPRPLSRTPVATTSRANRPSSDNTVMQDMVRLTDTARKQRESSPQGAADIQRALDRKDLQRQMVRQWKAGDVYSPHDISGVEMSKWRSASRKAKGKKDVLDMLKVNPLEHYKVCWKWNNGDVQGSLLIMSAQNFAMMSEYMTEMGRIKHNNETGLRPVNQRRMAKAVRRAIGLGLMPSVHKHPEILKQNIRY